MKKLVPAILCLIIVLFSCGESAIDTSSMVSDTASLTTSEYSSDVSSSVSGESSSLPTSSEEVYEFRVNAKSAVETIKSELSFDSAAVDMDRHFLSEKASVSEDMYEDFYGIMSYEISDNSLIAVFCCKTPDAVLRLKQQLEKALADDGQLAYLHPDAKVFSDDGYVIFVVTENNFDEENLVSKLIQ